MVSIIFQGNAVLHIDAECIVGSGLSAISPGSEQNYFQVDDRAYGGDVVLKYTPGHDVEISRRGEDPGVTHNVSDLNQSHLDDTIVLEIAAGRFTPPRPLDDTQPGATETHFSKEGVIFDLPGGHPERGFALYKTPSGYVTLPSNAQIVMSPHLSVVSLDFKTAIDDDIRNFSGNVVVINTGSECYAVGERGRWRVYVGVHATKTAQPLPDEDSAAWHRRYVGKVNRTDVTGGQRVPAQPSYKPEAFIPTVGLLGYQYGSRLDSGRIVVGAADTMQHLNLCEFEFVVPSETSFVYALAASFGIPEGLFAAIVPDPPTPPILFEKWKVGRLNGDGTSVDFRQHVYIESGIYSVAEGSGEHEPIAGTSIVIVDDAEEYVLPYPDAFVSGMFTEAKRVEFNRATLEVTGREGLPLVVFDKTHLPVGHSIGDLPEGIEALQFNRALFVGQLENMWEERLAKAGRPDEDVEREIRAEYDQRMLALQARVNQLETSLRAAGRPDVEVEAEWRQRVVELQEKMVPEEQLQQLANQLKTVYDRSLLDEIQAVKDLERKVSDGAGGSGADFSPLLEYLKLKFGVALPAEYAQKLRDYITERDNTIGDLEAQLQRAGREDALVTSEVVQMIIDIITVQRVFDSIAGKHLTDPRQLALEISSLAANASEELSREVERLRREVVELRSQAASHSDVVPGTPFTHILALATGIFMGKKIL